MANQIVGIRTVSENLRQATAAAITAGGGGFVVIGAPLINPSRIILFQNLTDVTLVFSDDGANEKFELPPEGFLLLDESTNKTGVSATYGYEAGTQFWVAYNGVANPTTGNVNLSTWYAKT